MQVLQTNLSIKLLSLPKLQSLFCHRRHHGIYLDEYPVHHGDDRNLGNRQERWEQEARVATSHNEELPRDSSVTKGIGIMGTRGINLKGIQRSFVAKGNGKEDRLCLWKTNPLASILSPASLTLTWMVADYLITVHLNLLKDTLTWTLGWKMTSILGVIASLYHGSTHKQDMVEIWMMIWTSDPSLGYPEGPQTSIVIDLMRWRSNSTYGGMNTSTMQRYAPRLDELNHGRINHVRSGQPLPDMSGAFRPPVPRPGSLGFVPGPHHPFPEQNSSCWFNE
ncbi:unnamed protein product [Fraxinus pennsylvanica]|uniref:Uncharacterized protein n=1 Tax=Fraxinus pennsylvanica TaxID=56036 RepID=A0AAD2AEY3_9LAMI|nr:unnamed protein product [Fraxinus pennsylvanica]